VLPLSQSAGEEEFHQSDDAGMQSLRQELSDPT